MISRVSYKTLFKYAYNEWGMEWAECYKTFIASGALKYEGITETYYYDDLADELDNDIFPPMFREPYATSLRIIRLFMLENGYTKIKFRHY